ncbi:helix-turn-helix domain-containing protein [Trichothermofontia sp.]
MVQTYLDLATINQLAKALPEPPLLTSHPVSWKYAFLAYFQHPGTAIDTHQTPLHLLEIIDLNTNKTSHFRRIGDLTSNEDICGGEIFLCPANTDHKVQWEEKSNFSLLLFNSSSIEHIANSLEIYHTIELIPQISLRDPKLVELVFDLQRILERNHLHPKRMRMFGDEIIKEILEHLVTNLSNSSLQHRSRHLKQQQKTLSEFKIQHIKRYIDEYLYNDQELPELEIIEQELAHILSVDAAKINKIIRQSTGLSLSKYIKLQILEYSKHLLIQDYSILDVAFKCGYNDSNYFTRIFKKKFGINPSEFRQQQQKILVDFENYANQDRENSDSLVS